MQAPRPEVCSGAGPSASYALTSQSIPGKWQSPDHKSNQETEGHSPFPFLGTGLGGRSAVLRFSPCCKRTHGPSRRTCPEPSHKTRAEPDRRSDDVAAATLGLATEVDQVHAQLWGGIEERLPDGRSPGRRAGPKPI